MGRAPVAAVPWSDLSAESRSERRRGVRRSDGGLFPPALPSLGTPDGRVARALRRPARGAALVGRRGGVVGSGIDPVGHRHVTRGRRLPRLERALSLPRRRAHHSCRCGSAGLSAAVGQSLFVDQANSLDRSDFLFAVLGSLAHRRVLQVHHLARSNSDRGRRHAVGLRRAGMAFVAFHRAADQAHGSRKAPSRPVGPASVDLRRRRGRPGDRRRRRVAAAIPRICRTPHTRSGALGRSSLLQPRPHADWLVVT